MKNLVTNNFISMVIGISVILTGSLISYFFLKYFFSKYKKNE